MARSRPTVNIYVSICTNCGGDALVISCIEDKAIINRILDYLMKKDELPPSQGCLLPGSRHKAILVDEAKGAV